MNRLQEFQTRLQTFKEKPKPRNSKPTANTPIKREKDHLGEAFRALAKNLQAIANSIQAASIPYVIPATTTSLQSSALSLSQSDASTGWTETACRNFDDQIKKDLAEVKAGALALRSALDARVSAAASARTIRQGLRDREKRAQAGLGASLQQGLTSAKEWLHGLRAGQSKDSKKESKATASGTDQDDASEDEMDDDIITPTSVKHYELILAAVDAYMIQCNSKLIELRHARQDNIKKYTQEQKRAQPKPTSTQRSASELIAESKKPAERRTSLSESSKLSSSSESREDDGMQMVQTQQQMGDLQYEARQWKATLETDLDAAQETERRMEAIAQLMQLFSIKVAEQAECIQSIHHNTVHVNVNIVSANDELRQAIARGGRA